MSGDKYKLTPKIKADLKIVASRLPDKPLVVTEFLGTNPIPLRARELTNHHRRLQNAYKKGGIDAVERYVLENRA